MRQLIGLNVKAIIAELAVMATMALKVLMALNTLMSDVIGLNSYSNFKS